MPKATCRFRTSGCNSGISPWHPAALAATWFGSGLLPKAPGTWGSLAALPFAWLIAWQAGPYGLLFAGLAIFAVGIQFHFMKKALQELKRTGDYTGMTQDEWITARKAVEDIIGLEDYYKIEQATVEKLYGKDKAKGKTTKRRR